MTLAFKLKKKFYFVAAGYFKFFANHSLKRWKPRVIIVTGSAGKTTMLNLIECQLGSKAHYSHNANSAFGIAFDIVGMHGITGSKLYWLALIFGLPIRSLFYRRKEKYYVVECDGERPHEAEFVAKWLKPEVSLWVSLGRSHAVFYENEVKSGRFINIDEAIAHEFAQIPKNTKKLVLIDGDNEAMREKCEGLLADVVGVHKSQLKDYAVVPNQATFTIGKKKFVFNEPMPRDVTTQLLMLDKLADYLGVKANTDLSNYKMPPARSNYLEGKNGIKIIDSSYNAHIISMTTVLDMMKEMKAPHKWLVIGDIIDQGALEGDEHKKLADLLLGVKAEKIIMIGRRTKKYTAPLLEGKCDFESFDKPQQALAFLEKNLTGKETVMFKGSQYLEWIVEKLLANPEDVVKLARQDAAHKKRRASWGLK